MKSFFHPAWPDKKATSSKLKPPEASGHRTGLQPEIRLAVSPQAKVYRQLWIFIFYMHTTLKLEARKAGWKLPRQCPKPGTPPLSPDFDAPTRCAEKTLTKKLKMKNTAFPMYG